MVRLAKFLLMAASVALLLASVLVLRGELGRPPQIPAQLGRVGTAAPPAPPESHLTRPPTILQVTPAQPSRGNAASAVREQSPAAGGVPEFAGLERTPDPNQDVPTEAQIVPDAWPLEEERWIGVPATEIAGAAALDQQLSAPTSSDTLDNLEADPPQHRPAQPSTHITVDQDSLWTISLDRYGTGEYYKALFALNRARIRRPDELEEGIVLETPPADVLRQRFPSLCPPALP